MRSLPPAGTAPLHILVTGKWRKDHEIRCTEVESLAARLLRTRSATVVPEGYLEVDAVMSVVDPAGEQLARRFAGARCAVLPGAHETFGLAALEAAACGAPVVTADTTPSATPLTGFVHTFRAGDCQDLLAAIERARSCDPSSPSRSAAMTSGPGCSSTSRDAASNR